jgi:hypothetical protein
VKTEKSDKMGWKRPKAHSADRRIRFFRLFYGSWVYMKSEKQDHQSRKEEKYGSDQERPLNSRRTEKERLYPKTAG